jgi:hypothetical protein
MSIFAFLFTAGLTLKGIFILIGSLIDSLSLKYDTKILPLPIKVEQEGFTRENKMEMKSEATSNYLKPSGKQIYMRTAS